MTARRRRPPVLRLCRAWLRRVWVRLREWSGDAAYDTYVARARGGEVLDRKGFYLDSLRRRYDRPNRCC